MPWLPSIAAIRNVRSLLAGVLLCASALPAAVLPPAPESHIRDDARLFSEPVARALSQEMRQFESATGISVFIDASTFLDTNETAGERARHLLREWAGGDRAIVLCVDRSSSALPAIQVSNDLWARFTEPEVLIALRASAQIMGRDTVTEQGISEGLREAMKRFTELESQARARTSGWSRQDQLMAAGFAALLLVGGLLVWLAVRLMRRHEAVVFKEHWFPEVESGQRFGLPNGGGVVVEISFRQTN